MPLSHLIVEVVFDGLSSLSVDILVFLR
jgi:hypothetical protein